MSSFERLWALWAAGKELLSPSAGRLDSAKRHFPPGALAVTAAPQMTQRTAARPRANNEGWSVCSFIFCRLTPFICFVLKKKFGVNILVFREGTTLLDGFIDFGRCGFEVLRGHLPFGWMSSGLKRAVKGIKADVTNLPGPMSSAVLIVVLTEMPSWSILVQPGPARSSLAALVTSPGVKGHVSHRGISASPRAAAPLSGDVTGRLPEHRLHSRRPGAALQTSRLHGNCSLRPCGCLS